MKDSYHIPALPLKQSFDTPAILKTLTQATRSLAEVKGRAQVIPNQGMLIDTLSLQEARESSHIENIVTTNDELFRDDYETDSKLTGATKEVGMYREALYCGFANLKDKEALSNKALIEMFGILKKRNDGFRTLMGTQLLNNKGETVYIPPQNPDDIKKHMSDLEIYMNSDDALDPLIRMAIIHHQFESIHPFPDGNGRIGRMLNVLYLVKEGLLEIPILYMSKGINRRKADYYRLLQKVRDDNAWEEWIIFMLEIVDEAAKITLQLINDIKTLMTDFKNKMRKNHPKIYSQDLINNIFKHPYTRIDYVMEELGVSRPTATAYLNRLSKDNLLTKVSEGRNNYFINYSLVALLSDGISP